MADQVAPSAEERALDALTKIMESAIAPDMLEAQQIILRRLALAGDLFPARVPPPQNITQVGGYLNLLADQQELRLQVLAATLGVAGPNPMPGWTAERPPMSFTNRPNDRPAGVAQASIPVGFTIRADFAAPLDDALARIRAKGGTLPLLSPPRVLPRPASGTNPPAIDGLALVGRTLEAVPAAALVDPANDPLAVGGAGTAGNEVFARQIDSAAPEAASVTSGAFNLWACTATACAQQAVTGAYIALTPLLNAAGWYQPTITSPTAQGSPGNWNRWTNVTGLVAGRTRFGDELSLLYTRAEIAQSALADKLDWIWNGTAFAAVP
ncbi:MAG: hypothetical protein ACOY4R_05570 [Pseudomonadota bacterium]